MAFAADRTLQLVVSDNTPFDLELFNDVDEVENLASATEAHLVVEASVGSATKLLDLSTEAPGSELVINTNLGTITATMTAAQADALVRGEYVSELTVLNGTLWKHSNRFTTRVLASVAANL